MSTSRLLWLLLGLGACTPEDTPKGGNPGGGTETDADADGHVAADDCDDTNPTIHPGAVEVCDGIDQDCDGVADEDASDAPTWYLDGDSDGAGDPAVSVTACAAPADHVDTGDDCDDADSAVAPGAVEQPGDEVDQDCDGAELCFVDADDDGDRPVDTPTVVSDDLDCTDAGEATATEPAADCDDTDPTVASILAEVPGDGTDQDCDGLELCWEADGLWTDESIIAFADELEIERMIGVPVDAVNGSRGSAWLKIGGELRASRADQLAYAIEDLEVWPQLMFEGPAAFGNARTFARIWADQV